MRYERSITIEMTWGETATRKFQFNGASFKREAVSPSRPKLERLSESYSSFLSRLLSEEMEVWNSLNR